MSVSGREANLWGDTTEDIVGALGRVKPFVLLKEQGRFVSDGRRNTIFAPTNMYLATMMDTKRGTGRGTPKHAYVYE